MAKVGETSLKSSLTSFKSPRNKRRDLKKESEPEYAYDCGQRCLRELDSSKRELRLQLCRDFQKLKIRLKTFDTSRNTSAEQHATSFMFSLLDLSTIFDVVEELYQCIQSFKERRVVQTFHPLCFMSVLLVSITAGGRYALYTLKSVCVTFIFLLKMSYPRHIETSKFFYGPACSLHEMKELWIRRSRR